MKPDTLGESYRHYLNHADLRSTHTLSAYARSIDLFFQYLADRNFDPQLPIQRAFLTTAEEIKLEDFSQADQPIFLNFAKWLRAPSSRRSGDKRPYARATVELRVAGVLHWFQYMDNQRWLPDPYWLHHANHVLREYWRDHQAKREKQIDPVPDLNAVVMFFDTQPMPPAIRTATDPSRPELWETKRLRNRALLHALAETGGRVSEILSLNADTFSKNSRGKSEAMQLTVMGKGGHQHVLHLHTTLPAIYDYLKARETNDEWRSSIPLFISHDPRYRGSRMSRIVAWRVVHRAAKALGLPDISPQDFRHWRALQLIHSGYTPEQVQEYLGHRSVETIRSFYLAGEAE